MYETFYRLTTKPFRLSPDPHFFYASAGHKRALSYLLYGINQAEGFVVITGTPGTGKTTLAQKLLSELNESNMVVAHLSTTQLDAEDLLRMVATAFRLRSENVSKAGLLKDIESFLLARARERKRCLLVVDEAQNLPSRSVEELRMLSNFQVGSKALLQCFLLGQEQFRGMLDSPQLEQLKQRVIANFHLQPLSRDETRGYIEARLRHAGWNNDPVIDTSAFTAIHDYTAGIPRRINIFCDRLFLFGYLEELHTFTAQTVQQVIAELENEVVRGSSKPVVVPISSASSTEEKLPARAVNITNRIADRAEPQAKATASQINESPVAGMTRTIAASYAASLNNGATPPPEPRSTPHVQRVATESRDAISALRSAKASPPESTAVNTTSQVSPTLSPNVDPSPAPDARASRNLLRWLTGLTVLVLGFGAFIWNSVNTPSRPVVTTQQTEGSPVPQTPKRVEPIAPPVSDAGEIIATERSISDATEPSVAPPVQEAPVKPSPSVSPEPKSEPEKKASSPVDAPIVISPKKSVPDKSMRQDKPRPVTPTAANNKTLSVPEVVSAPSQQNTEQLTPPIENTAPPSTPAVSPRVDTPIPTVPTVDTKAIPDLTKEELSTILIRFISAYEDGNLTQFTSLFDEHAHTDDRVNREGIRNDYDELFKRTSLRQMLLGDMQWTQDGLIAQGRAPFTVRIQQPQESAARTYQGELTLRVEKFKTGIFITEMRHKYAP